MSNGIIVTGSFPQALRPGIDFWFGDEYKDYEPLFSQIFNVVVPDSRAYVEDAEMSMFGPLLAKDQGSAVRYDSSRQVISPRYDHLTYALGFMITMEMMADGLALSNAERWTRELKRSALITRETVAHNVLNNAFDSSVVMTNGDASNLLSTTHATPAGSQSNRIGTDADLSEAALEQANIDILNFKDNRGKKIRALPETLIVNSASVHEQDRILNSALRVATTDNDKNSLSSQGVIKKVVVTPYTTDTDAWFITTSVPRGLMFHNRMDPNMSSDNDFDTENAKFKVMMRFSCGWTDFRGIYGSQGA